MDYPGSFVSSDKAAIKLQTRFVRQKQIEYGTVVLAAACAGLAPAFGGWIYVAASLSLVVALTLFMIDKHKAYGVGWYRCRAMAEAIKAETWKFNLCQGDYACSDQDAERVFIGILKTIQNQTHASSYLAEFLEPNLPEVTSAMRDLRTKSVLEKIDVYKKDRVVDERGWYSGKAKTWAKCEGEFFWLIVVVIVAGIVAGFLQFKFETHGYSVVEILAAVSAALSGWMQFRRYENLATMYTVSSSELASLLQFADTATSASELAQLVTETELVISKEHTIWIQRGHVA